MPTLPCKIAISTAVPGCAGVDEPVINFSSEAPDMLYFTGIGFPIYNPYIPAPLGGGQYIVAACAGVVFSAQSQEEANLLAQVAGIICQGQNGGGGIGVGGNGNGAPTPNTNTPSTPPIHIYSTAQTAFNSCSSFAQFHFTVPAGAFVKTAGDQGQVAAAQTAANAQALAYAQQRVSSFSFCIASQAGNTWAACLGALADFTLTLSGGLAGLSAYWSVSAGSLPPGMSLLTTQPQASIEDSNGDTWVTSGGSWTNLTTGQTQPTQPAGTGTTTYGKCDVEGTPTVAGNYSFTIRASSVRGSVYCEFPCTMSVLGVTNGNPLPTGSLSQLYNVLIMVAGGVAPYSFGIDPTGGSLPPGIGIEAFGNTSYFFSGYSIHPISPTGYPTHAGTYNFNLIVTDSLGQQCSRNFTIVVVGIGNDPVNVTLSCSSGPPTASGSVPANTYAVPGGTPNGKSIANAKAFADAINQISAQGCGCAPSGSHQSDYNSDVTTMANATGLTLPCPTSCSFAVFDTNGNGNGVYGDKGLSAGTYTLTDLGIIFGAALISGYSYQLISGGVPLEKFAS